MFHGVKFDYSEKPESYGCVFYAFFLKHLITSLWSRAPIYTFILLCTFLALHLVYNNPCTIFTLLNLNQIFVVIRTGIVNSIETNIHLYKKFIIVLNTIYFDKYLFLFFLLCQQLAYLAIVCVCVCVCVFFNNNRGFFFWRLIITHNKLFF
jgi:hypothetical protein